MIVWPGLRRSVSAIRRLFNSASFYAPLTHSAIPTRAASGTTATFTRATAKTWQNNDGYLVTGVAGEIGFVGARRVRNWIQAPTENWSSAGWVKSGISVSGNRLTATGANGIIYDNAALGMEIGRTAVGSVTLSRVTGTGNIDVSTNGGTTWTTVSVTGARVSVSLTGNINGQFAIRIVTSGDAVEATYPQLEDVTAQTTQTAGEYVSVGVESAPYYHGSFVDGVRAFPTDISGNPIPSTTLLGYSAEGARTNYALWNRDLTNVAWTKTSCTAALTATGADNAANSASTLTATAGNATCLQSITRVSAQRVTGCKIKRRTGTGTINMTQDNGVTWTPVTVTSAYTNVAIPAATAANPIIGFQIVTNGDAIDVDFVMHEEAAFVSSSIATTTVAVKRNADVLTYSSSGNIDGTKGWAYAEVTMPTSVASVSFVAATGGNLPAYSSSDSELSVYDGTAERKFLPMTTSPAVKNIATTWGGTVTNASLSGTVGTSDGFDGNLDIGADLFVGIDSVSTGNLNGTIRNIRIGQRALSSSELQAVTSP